MTRQRGVQAAMARVVAVDDDDNTTALLMFLRYPNDQIKIHMGLLA